MLQEDFFFNRLKCVDYQKLSNMESWNRKSGQIQNQVSGLDFQLGKLEKFGKFGKLGKLGATVLHESPL